MCVVGGYWTIPFQPRFLSIERASRRAGEHCSAPSLEMQEVLLAADETLAALNPAVLVALPRRRHGGRAAC